MKVTLFMAEMYCQFHQHVLLDKTIFLDSPLWYFVIAKWKDGLLVQRKHKMMDFKATTDMFKFSFLSEVLILNQPNIFSREPKKRRNEESFFFPLHWTRKLKSFSWTNFFSGMLVHFFICIFHLGPKNTQYPKFYIYWWNRELWIKISFCLLSLCIK